MSRIFKFKTFLMILFFFIFGCRKECFKDVELNGYIMNTINEPIQGVQVYLIERDGSQTLLGTSDSNGYYSFTLENKISLGGLYTLYKKEGYAESNTSATPIESNTSSCDKQQVSRNIVLKNSSI